MILRDSNTAIYKIYDIGSNAILAAEPLGQLGLVWQVTGLNMILRNSNTGAFEVYDISTNNITGTASIGKIGLEWQVSDDFSSRPGESDMLSNNAITSAAPVGQVGLEWRVAGLVKLGRALPRK
jgi:hypothetical protein